MASFISQTSCEVKLGIVFFAHGMRATVTAGTVTLIVGKNYNSSYMEREKFTIFIQITHFVM